MERRAPQMASRHSRTRPGSAGGDKKKSKGSFVMMLVFVNVLVLAGFMWKVAFPTTGGSVKSPATAVAPSLRGSTATSIAIASASAATPTSKYTCVEPCRQLSNGVAMPLLLYGTAWKKERTEELVKLAFRNGFRGIDSANQGRHYNEAGTGTAVAASVAKGLSTRGELFLQSKYTYPRGHESGSEPYDVAATVREQVRQSFASSLQKFGTDYLDSYLLHGPLVKKRLRSSDLEVWATLEELYAEGRVRAIGVSNFDAHQLSELISSAKVVPHLAQVRTFAVKGWDDRSGGVRKICQEHSIVYEAYSLLTANRAALKSTAMQTVAASRKETEQQVAFRYALGLGMVVLTGTTDDAHMAQDLFVAQTLKEAPLLQPQVDSIRTAGMQ